MGHSNGRYYLSDFTADEIESLLHKVKAAKTFDAHNCPNCGAPIRNRYKCEYCDTAFETQDWFERKIEMQPIEWRDIYGVSHRPPECYPGRGGGGAGGSTTIL